MEVVAKLSQLTCSCYPLCRQPGLLANVKDFEVRHGNEDTIREMLRIRRSVQATYNTQVNFYGLADAQGVGSATGTGEQALAVALASQV